ncbi:MAG: hypothetical protein ACI8WB_005311 [Phenylobacterium sp.]|jgi:hypothetical protein
MTRRFYLPLIIASALLLSGCATLQLVSFGISTISYVVSGKSISDHAISKVMGQDCALHRIVMTADVCQEPGGAQLPPGVLIAQTKDASNTSPPAANKPWYRQASLGPQATGAPTNAAYAARNRARAKANGTTVTASAKPNTKPRTIPSTKPSRVSNAIPSRAARTNMHPAVTAKVSYQQDPSTKSRFTYGAKKSANKDMVVKTLPATMRIRGEKASDKARYRRAPATKNSFVANQSVAQLKANYLAPLDALDSTSGDKPQLFAVIGSFNELAYAQKRIDQYRGLHAQVITTPKGATKYRVIVGPLSAAQFNQQIANSNEPALKQAWRFRLCSASKLPPPCNTMLASR